jgi:glycosyltransferase involved in cell wall biosynthesis
MPALSVIICTHNPPPDYFRQCLDALSGQTLVRNRGELIAVDNRSDEPLAARNDFSWGPAARLVREEMLGLTRARLREIRESQGDLLIFVDDDSVLDADFLETAPRIAEKRPFHKDVWSQPAPACHNPCLAAPGFA